MPILQEIPIQLMAEGVVAAQAGGRVLPALIPNAAEALAQGQALWQPRAVYDWVEVCGVDGERVRVIGSGQVAGAVELRVGPKADLLGDARLALVGVGTIGPALEEEVSRLGSAREGLKSYMLDAVGVLALGAVGEALRCLAEEEAARRGWGLSPALSPGSLVGWSLWGQRELCGQLPLDLIGVQLSSHCVLVPQKSFSVLIGLGPGYADAKVGSVCKYCALQGTCWRRRGDPS